LRQLSTDDRLAEQFRTAARRWVEENFDAHKNAARLLTRFRSTLAAESPNR